MKSLVLALAVTLAAPVNAQTPSPASLAAATALVDSISTDAMMRESMASVLAGMRSGEAIGKQLEANPGFSMARAKNPVRVDAGLKRIGVLQAGAIERAMTGVSAQLRTAMIQSYATSFSADELRRISAFYKTPLGRLMLARLPKVMQNTNQLVQETIQPRVMQEMKGIGPAVQAELRAMFPQAPAKVR